MNIEDATKQPEKENKFLFAGVSNEHFIKILHAHTWSFEYEHKDMSFEKFISIIRDEQILRSEAIHRGPEITECLFFSQYTAVRRLINKQQEKDNQRIEAYINSRLATGDEEYDEFRKLVYFFDWYWDFSDDSRVRRHEGAKHDKIQALLKKHTNNKKYQEYYDFIREQKTTGK